MPLTCFQDDIEIGSDGYPDEFHGLSSSRSHPGKRKDSESGDPDTSGASTEDEEMKDPEVSISTS